MSIKWVEADELDAAIGQAVRDVASVLDIGPGIRPQTLVESELHICCEPHFEYRDRLQEMIAAGKNLAIMACDWAEAVEILPPESVDSITIIDVIEHLEKEDGMRLLKKTEAIAREQIIIFTPLGFLPQAHETEKDAWGLNGAAWQDHKSGWSPEDFDDSWDFIAVREYFFKNGPGEILEKPFGCFYAIKEMKRGASPAPLEARLDCDDLRLLLAAIRGKETEFASIGAKGIAEFLSGGNETQRREGARRLHRLLLQQLAVRSEQIEAAEKKRITTEAKRELETSEYLAEVKRLGEAHAATAESLMENINKLSEELADAATAREGLLAQVQELTCQLQQTESRNSQLEAAVNDLENQLQAATSGRAFQLVAALRRLKAALPF